MCNDSKQTEAAGAIRPSNPIDDIARMIAGISADEIAAGGDFRAIEHSIPSETLPFLGEGRFKTSPTYKRVGGDVFRFIEPALRLASALLLHEDSLRFFHALKVAAGRYKEAGLYQGEPLRTRHRFKAKETLTVAEADGMRDFLHNLHVDKQIVAAEGDLLPEGARGITIDFSGGGVHAWHLSSPFGWRFGLPAFHAIVMVHPRLTDACILTQHLARQQPDDQAALHKAHSALFSVSACLCHEVAHVRLP